MTSILFVCYSAAYGPAISLHAIESRPCQQEQQQWRAAEQVVSLGISGRRYLLRAEIPTMSTAKRCSGGGGGRKNATLCAQEASGATYNIRLGQDTKVGRDTRLTQFVKYVDSTSGGHGPTSGHDKI